MLDYVQRMAELELTEERKRLARRRRRRRNIIQRRHMKQSSKKRRCLIIAILLIMLLVPCGAIGLAIYSHKSRQGSRQRRREEYKARQNGLSEKDKDA